jgi:hypothetical protein
MDANLVFIIGIAVLALVVGAAIYASRRKSRSIRDRFGDEYSHALHDAGGRRKAEAELRRREKRVSRMPIRPLRADEMELFQMRWRKVQAHFVDNPGSAIAQADRLLDELMEARGYTSRDFEQRAADLSVGHAHLVTDYRAAHEIIQRPRMGAEGTEDMRRAMIHYRALFEDLLEVTPDDRAFERRSFARDDEDRAYDLRDEDYDRRNWDRDHPEGRRPHH